MRSAYGLAKVAAFVLLGLVVALGASGGTGATDALAAAAATAVAVSLAICLVRGLPGAGRGPRLLAVELRPHTK
jgi:hypothetical protein